MGRLKRKPAVDATKGELSEFLSLHELSPAPSSTKADLLELLKTAQLGDTILVSNEPAVAADPFMTENLDEMFLQEFIIENERFMRIRLQEDTNGEDKDSSVPVIYDTDRVFLPRQRDIVIRERFVRVLNDAKQMHTTQSQGDGSQKFSAAKKHTSHRHPFTFMGVVGRVADGIPPNLPPTTIVIR